VIDGTVELLDRIAAASHQGMLPARVFNDRGLFELESRRIFSHAWLFLGHESEIPKPGDYVMRYMASNCLILVRDDEGKLRALFNTCRHRGSQVCRSEAGNASQFRCGYHGWAYRNTGELAGVPYAQNIFGGNFDRSRWGLMEVPRLECYEGLIFASLDPQVMPLREYIGDAAWYLDFYLKKSAAGLEVVGPPHRWVVSADWKLGADNFSGDGYHTGVAHRAAVMTGLLYAAETDDFAISAPQWVTRYAQGGFLRVPPGSYGGYPPSIAESWRRNMNPGQLRVLDEMSFFQVHATLFPNLSFLSAASVPDPGPPVPWLTIRLWRPLGPGVMEMWSWFLVEKDAPQEFKDASRRSFLLTFGTAGTLEGDDIANWSGITKMAAGEYSSELYLNYQMGMDYLEPLSNWPGPGAAYKIDYTEFAQRQFWTNWLEYMQSAR
jgi:phenylpropionate dioxygenase-like ring-hydroxylating dioxygenase large terminal subunit